MKVKYSREELQRIAAEKLRKKKEKEEREENELYQRITSGIPWMVFKSVVVFCTLMALVTTIEVFVDGKSKKIAEEEWKIDRTWEWPWHQIIDVEGYLFAPKLNEWLDHVDNSMELTYTPIFQTGKKLSYDLQINESSIRSHEEIRFRSIFSWFPFLQLFLIIPLLTFIFKRKAPWFNFARLLSLFFVFPATLLVTYYLL